MTELINDQTLNTCQTLGVVCKVLRRFLTVEFLKLFCAEWSVPPSDQAVSGHQVGVSSEGESPVELRGEVAGPQSRISPPVTGSLSDGVGGLVGHEYPGDGGVPEGRVVVSLPVKVGQVEEDGRAVVDQAPVPCDPTPHPALS